MKDFFRYITDIPAGSGFDMFGACHIIWLSVIAVFTLILSYIYTGAGNGYDELNAKALKKQDTAGIHRNRSKQDRIRLFIGVIMPVISIYRDGVLILTGHFDRFYLPLHLCGMALWIGALYCFTRWRFAGVVYVLLCVPGALSALIFPDWVDYPFWNYMHIHDFISHGLIVAWGICLLLAGEVVPQWREFWMPVLFGITGIIILTPVNNWLGTNYWFLEEPSAGSPLVPIMNITGKEWYVAGYVLFVAVVVLVWMAVIRIVRHIWEIIFIRLMSVKK